MYAVIALQWHQYIVREWDTIVVDNISSEVWEILSNSNVLAKFDSDWKNVVVWKPFIENAEISLKVVENKKWEKMHITKFKRKNRYSRRIWFRHQQTVLYVEKLKI